MFFTGTGVAESLLVYLGLTRSHLVLQVFGLTRYRFLSHCLSGLTGAHLDANDKERLPHVEAEKERGNASLLHLASSHIVEQHGSHTQ